MGVKSSFGGTEVNASYDTKIMLSWTTFISHISVKATKVIKGGNPEVGNVIVRFNRRKAA